MLERGFFRNLFLIIESCIACSKFHFKKDLSYIKTNWLTDSVNHVTGFCLILPFTEKKYV